MLTIFILNQKCWVTKIETNRTTRSKKCEITLEFEFYIKITDLRVKWKSNLLFFWCLEKFVCLRRSAYVKGKKNINLKLELHTGERNIVLILAFENVVLYFSIIFFLLVYFGFTSNCSKKHDIDLIKRKKPKNFIHFFRPNY